MNEGLLILAASLLICLPDTVGKAVLLRVFQADSHSREGTRQRHFSYI